LGSFVGHIARVVERTAVAGLFAVTLLIAQPYTRGIGIYPGDPREDSSPVLQIDHTTYRNLALRRPAYQSSSYDYNLTAQLITDGIIDTKLPRWIAVSTSEAGYLPRPERETLLDHNPFTTVQLRGSDVWVEIELHGGEAPLEVDRIDIAMASNTDPSGWICLISGSDDGRQYRELGRGTPAAAISIPFAAPSTYRRYRIEFRSAIARTFTIADIDLFRQNHKAEIAGPFDFTSAWMSASSGTEWVSVDLGALCTFDRVDLHWVRRAAEAELQVSNDAANWRTVAPALGDSLKFPPVEARYVRLLMTKPASPEGYILSEMEVYGRGGPIARDKSGPPLTTGWRVHRDSLVHASGEAISRPGYSDREWVPATVPGTVLASYYNIGAIPDPLYGDNQLAISDSFFYADFWYRNEFVAPPRAPGQRLWLNFDGINWKAEVFLNGEKLGLIEGAFERARFDVTARIHAGQKNVLAVLIEKNANPGTVHEKTAETPSKNGGALGADNPTFHASVGWDWIPTIRGRNTGIWNKVYFTTTGSVTIEDPSVTTKLTPPDLSLAQVTIEYTLRNHSPDRVDGTFIGRFGNDGFGHSVTLEAGEARTITESLGVPNPRLWWPNGYGDPNLYPVELQFHTGPANVQDSISFEAGLRQFTYSEEGGALRIWVNGKRFVPRGGNWGFSEAMLRYRTREYDAAVRYHRDMNFTMIRNWVGQTGDDAFYDACDRYGIVVWQDFWLANPADGPDPDDTQMFLRNARDTVLRIRRHPSVGLYCGRNEGFPPKPIDDGLRAILNELVPGIHYIPSSADGPVSGHGPYRVMPPSWYFTERATPKLHSEMGMPAVPPLESVTEMLPSRDRQGAVAEGALWGLHDFTAAGAQGGAWFRDRIDHSYGGASTLPAWLDLAQFIDYEGYRAMFEAQSKNRMGLLLWMSHPAWPSFVWQTYDYYLEPTAAYFGAKKGAEPLHIQWNPVAETIEVVNYTGASLTGLTARAEIRNLDGSVAWRKEAAVDSPEDSTVTVFPMEYPASVTPVHFLKLALLERGRTEPVSENFYWRATEQDDFRALRELPKVALDVSTHVERSGNRWLLTTTLHNPAAAPALMVRLKAVRETTGDRILPVLYSDNYISLMPGEQRTIRTEVEDRDTRGERPKIVIHGFNL
jgi:hypothetical protein